MSALSEVVVVVLPAVVAYAAMLVASGRSALRNMSEKGLGLSLLGRVLAEIVKHPREDSLIELKRNGALVVTRSEPKRPAGEGKA